jgi:hypothetical protein
MRKKSAEAITDKLTRSNTAACSLAASVPQIVCIKKTSQGLAWPKMWYYKLNNTIVVDLGSLPGFKAIKEDAEDVDE